jgi:tetratricopeptide (TPR) repeat protein
LFFLVLIHGFPPILRQSFYLQANPLIFKIGDATLCKGIELAVLSMRKGEVSLIEMTVEYMKEIKDINLTSVMPSDMHPFEILLLDIIPAKIENLNLKNDKKFNGIEKVLKQKEIGNSFYKKADFINAEKVYSQALLSLESCKLDPKFKEIQCVLLSNLSAVYLKIGQNSKSIEFCSKVLEIDQFNVKALFRRAMANLNLSNNEKAFSDLQLASKFEPENKEIQTELQKLKLTNNLRIFGKLKD